ncbi:hypothetical protein ACP70R_008390 [Stipagrostis hirtigluma subsp. patula]
MDEGKAINLSLTAIGDVIAALGEREVMFLTETASSPRYSVVFLAVVQPSEDDVCETVCSLKFAQEPGHRIKKRRSKNLKMLKRKRLAELHKEVCDTEQEPKSLNEQIRRAEMTLEEKKKLSSAASQALSDEKGSPTSTQW